MSQAFPAARLSSRVTYRHADGTIDHARHEAPAPLAVVRQRQPGAGLPVINKMADPRSGK